MFQRFLAGSPDSESDNETDSDLSIEDDEGDNENPESTENPPPDIESKDEGPEVPPAPTERPMAKRSSRLARPIAPENFSQLRDMWEAKAANGGF